MLAGLVRAVPIVMVGVLAKDGLQVLFAVMRIRPVYSPSALCIRLPTKQSARGFGGEILTGPTPSLAKIASKALVNAASRSRIRETEGADPAAEIHE